MAKCEHVFFLDGSHGENARSFKCDHCGGVFRVSMPIQVKKFVLLGKAFSTLHRECPAPAEPLEKR